MLLYTAYLLKQSLPKYHVPLFIYVFEGRDNAVDIATPYGPNCTGFEFR
jgi:hypothetical protein